MRIRNFGAGTPKLNEGIITSGSAATDYQAVYASGSIRAEELLLDDIQPIIQFKEEGSDRATIEINDSDNLVIVNQSSNKHVVFKTNDAGVVREGFRVGGVTPEVVVNEGSESLVDFRVESGNSTHMLFVDGGNDKVGIGTDQPDYTLDVAGDIGVDQFIYHNGDADTLINFADDKIVLKAGNLALVTAEKNSSAPHEVTINDGGNNVDFVVKGNGSNQGNPGMKFDADTNKLGINGIGTPLYELDVDGKINSSGDLYVSGNLYVVDTAGLYADKIRRRSDSDNTTKILLNDELIKLYAGHSTEDIVRIGDTNYGTDNNFFVSGSTRSRGTATQGTAVFGGDLVVSGTLTAVQKHICTAKYTVDNNTQQYIRFNAAGSNGSPSVNNKFVTPCPGSLSYVMIRSTGTPGQTEVGFHRAADGTGNLATTPIETQNITMGTANTAYRVYFTSAADFGPGDIVGLSLNPAANHGNVDITLVFELDFVL